MNDCISFVGSMLIQLFNVALPWGISFGVVVVGIFSAPLLVKAFRRFF